MLLWCLPAVELYCICVAFTPYVCCWLYFFLLFCPLILMLGATIMCVNLLFSISLLMSTCKCLRYVPNAFLGILLVLTVFSSVIVSLAALSFDLTPLTTLMFCAYLLPFVHNILLYVLHICATGKLFDYIHCSECDQQQPTLYTFSTLVHHVWTNCLRFWHLCSISRVRLLDSAGV